MADHYGTTTPPPPSHAEDISTYLRSLLHHSSSSAASSSASSCMPFNAQYSRSPPPPPHPPFSDNMSAGGLVLPVPADDGNGFGGSGVKYEAEYRVRDGSQGDSSSGVNFCDPGVFLPADVKENVENAFCSVGLVDSDSNTSSKRRGFSADNDPGDFSCDSEKGPEPSEAPPNPPPSRTSSKRSRAAEVHNLSEKRRRSRINEKMKALQSLIPHSNKTDKASMLDDAIEYLKQLQLQVQMLSVRNGLSLHPMYLTGVLQPVQVPQMGMPLDRGTVLLNSSRGSGPTNPETSLQTVYNLPNCDPSNQPPAIPSVTNITNSEIFDFEPHVQFPFEQFNLPSPSKDICRESTAIQLDVQTPECGKNLSTHLS